MRSCFLVVCLVLSSNIVMAQGKVKDEPQFLEILITSGLRESRQSDEPISATVHTAQGIENQGADHFKQLISSIPNALFSGETSRPRYIQLRGIGERSNQRGQSH